MNAIKISFLTWFVSTALVVPAQAHEWMAPQEAAAIKNPMELSQESASRGKHLFLENCATCHGEYGEGQSAEFTGLSKGTPDLIKRLSTHSEGDFFWKIKNGRGDMPGFKDDLSDQDIWDVLNFLKSPDD